MQSGSIDLVSHERDAKQRQSEIVEVLSQHELHSEFFNQQTVKFNIPKRHWSALVLQTKRRLRVAKQLILMEANVEQELKWDTTRPIANRRTPCAGSGRFQAL